MNKIKICQKNECIQYSFQIDYNIYSLTKKKLFFQLFKFKIFIFRYLILYY